MENNFNNDKMMNDGFEAMETCDFHKPMNGGQIAAIAIIGSIVGVGVIKGIDWLIKRKQAKELTENQDGIERVDIETVDIERTDV